MILGSEGRLGIVTEAWVQVHRVPEKRDVYAYFFPNFEVGLKAMQEIAESDATPSITRVSDNMETAILAGDLQGEPRHHQVRLGQRAAGDLQVEGLEPRRDLPLVHRLRGQRAPRQAAEEARRRDRQEAQRHGRRQGPRHPLRPEEVRHPLHPRLPARPGRRGRRLRERGAVVEAAGPARRGREGGPRRVRQDRPHRVSSSATSRTRTTRARASTSRSGSSSARTPLRRLRHRQVGHPAGLHRQRRLDLAPPRCRARARAVARTGHLRERRGRDAGPVRFGRSEGQLQPGQGHRRSRVSTRATRAVR